MYRLSSKDSTALLSAIAELHSDVNPQTLAARALASVAQVIEADSVAFTGFRYEGEMSGLVWDSSEALSQEDIEIFGAYVHEQPLFSAYLVERRTETLKITDLVSSAKFERTAIYNEFYRRVGVKNQLVSPLAVASDLLVTCSINTGKPDFSERDRTVMNLIAPHLIAALRNAFAYERLSTALDAVECGVVAVDSDGKPLFVSEFARQLLQSYFVTEKLSANLLPPTLSSWLKQSISKLETDEFLLPETPLTVVNQAGKLVVRHTFNRGTRESTLLLEESRNPSAKMFEGLQLTNREVEILWLIANGKTDAAIAVICGISPRTVNKHVENIYSKLGVETRTAAMLRALEIM